MSAEILSSPPSSASGIGAWLSDLEGRLRYQPWWIYLTTLDRRLLVALLAGPPLLLLILALAIGLSVGSECSNGRYTGRASITQSGLRCVPWNRLNRTLHTVTPDRYPDEDLVESYCRNPDSSERPWCYTSLTAKTFDFCSVASCNSSSKAAPDSSTGPPAGTDWACDETVTVLHPALQQASGVFRATRQWANGRGVWQRQQQAPGPAVCLSWHARYRHWWLGPCTHRGRNAGYAWLEEDGRCPYDGRVWREAGSDVHLEQMLVGRSSCMQFGTIWKGETLDSRVWHNGGLFAPKSFTPGECQDLCLQSVGCVGFNWFPNMNCTLFTNLDRDVGKVRGAVRGHPSCKGKERLAGCPPDAERLSSGVCLAFLPSCPLGCSRWQAMEECEETGGFLADSLGLQELLELLQLATRRYNTSSWWTGATDFKKESGKFSWERKDLTLSDAEELWANGTFGPTSKTAEDETGHQCVFIDHFQGEVDGEGMRLDAISCQEELARPLCQYQHTVLSVDD